MNATSIGSNNEYPYPVPLHVQELIRFRDERRTLQFTLAGGGTLDGAVRWFDEQTIHVVTPAREEITLMRRAILYYRQV